MLGRNLPFGGDHTHLGMPAVLWAHGPEGEACGRAPLGPGPVHPEGPQHPEAAAGGGAGRTPKRAEEASHVEGAVEEQLPAPR